MPPKLLEKELDGELMVYDPQRDAVHVLNPTARMVYRLHREGKDPQAIERALRAQWRVPDDRPLGEDVQGCLGELRDRGLLD